MVPWTVSSEPAIRRDQSISQSKKLYERNPAQEIRILERAAFYRQTQASLSIQASDHLVSISSQTIAKARKNEAYQIRKVVT